MGTNLVNQSNRSLTINLLVVLALLGLAIEGISQSLKVKKLEQRLDAQVQLNALFTQTINKQGKAMSAVLEKLEMDVAEVTK